MPSERTQRRIDAFLDEADVSASNGDWTAVAEKARAVLAMDPDNEDAPALLRAAEANLVAPAAPLTPTPAPTTTATPAVPESFAAGRYHVRKFLGEGGKKRVFLAHDALLDRDVAFALIKTEGLDATGRERITREAQAMGRMGTHPHVVTIFEIGEEGGAPYVVTELMGGGDVEGLLEKDGGALPLARTLDIAKGVARGLAFAHERGIVHRDLKPGNVWLTAEGVAKIGDFGLAVALNRSRLTQHGLMVGTFGYMPPEQALGGEVTPQADLYSLGAMLYEMVTGKPPFQADDPTAVISQHINTPPVAPSWHSEHCPPGLEALILKLLAKVPADRPASAVEVLAALEAVDPAAPSVRHSDSSANPLDRLARGVFVGRERELERLRAAFDEAFAGRGSVVMLVGEPGIGKTRTVQELSTYARMRGAKVLWGRAHEASGAPPYWPWTQVARAYRDLTPDDIRRRQYEPYAVDLQRIFPNLRTLFPNLPDPPPVDSEEAQFRLFDALSSFIRAVSAETPLVIVLDDLHWADRSTLRMLTHLAREVGMSRLLVTGTYRDTDLDRRHPLSQALAEMNREDLFARIQLRGLTESETAAYIRDTVQAEPAAELVQRVHAETEGNPFFLSEVVRLMAEEGAFSSGAMSKIRIPEGVKDALGRRLDKLSPEANELLSVAAVVGREFDHAQLVAVSGKADDEVLRIVEEALAARVLEETSAVGGCRFTHALMQETLLGELSAARRVRLHGQIAEALEALYSEAAEAHAPELSRHYLESAVLHRAHGEKAVRYSRVAGEQAEMQAAWAEAAKHYEGCLTQADAAGSAVDDEATLRWALGRCARYSGDYRTAWRNLMLGIQLFESRHDYIQAARVTLDALQVMAPPGRHRALVAAALEHVTGTNTAEEARLLARQSQQDGGGGQARAGALERAQVLANTLTLPDVAAMVAFERASWHEWRFDFDEAVPRLRETAEEFGRLGMGSELARTRFVVARALAWQGQLDEANAAAEEAVRASRRVADYFWVQNSLLVQCGPLLARWELPSCANLLEQMGEEYYWRFLMQARLHELAGNGDAAISRLPAPALAGGVTTFLTHVLGGRARTLYRAGQQHSALRELDHLQEAFALLETETEFPDLTGLAEADEALADLASLDFVRRAYRHLATPVVDGRDPLRMRWLVGTAVDQLRGRLALRLDMLGEAEAHFRTGLHWCERERCPVEAGRCHEGLSEVSDRRGDHSMAMEHLDAAGELFARHGAKLYLDQVLAKKQFLKA